MWNSLLLLPHIFWVCYFSLSQCVISLCNIEVSMFEDYVVKTLEHQNNNASSKINFTLLWDRNCAAVRRSFDLYSSLNFPSDQKLLQNAEVTKNGKALVFPHGNSLAFGFCHGLRTSRKFLIENPKILDLGRPIEHNIFWGFWGIWGIFRTHFGKVHIFWEGHKILQNLYLTFVLCSAIQK